MPSHYFLGNRLLGTGRAYWDDTTPVLGSLIFICPICGECWARVAQVAGGNWYPVTAGCPRHLWTADVPGTLLHPWQRQLAGLPPEVLRHEFLIRQHLIGTTS